MYGYELDYGYEPATEGIGSFFEMVGAKIKKVADMIKKAMDAVKLKIQRMTGSTTAEQSRADTKEVNDKIKSIGDNIANILDECSNAIDALYDAYYKVAKFKELKNKSEYNKLSKETDTKHITYTADDKNGKTKYYDVTKNMTSHNGMNKIRKDLDETESSEWNKEKQRLGVIFANQAGLADKVASDLKSLSSYGPLTESATKTGYDELRDLFGANGRFGQKWKKIKIAAEWSTGFIKESLNKVVKMYDVGVRATQAFGKRLAGGNFRDDSGDKIAKNDKLETMGSYKMLNKVYNDKDNYNIKTNRKNVVNFDNVANAKESALLDRLYQMAYEDVMNDLAEQQYAMEAYDMVPGAYEFVDDLGYDPTLDPEL